MILRTNPNPLPGGDALPDDTLPVAQYSLFDRLPQRCFGAGPQSTISCGSKNPRAAD